MTGANEREMLTTLGANEQRSYYKKKWHKEHTSTIIVCTIAWSVLMLALRLQNIELYLCCIIGSLLASVYYVALHDRLMWYIERHKKT